MEVKLYTGLDIGHIPATPMITTHGEEMIPDAYNVLRTIASRYGFIVGYKQEQRGLRIQHVLPNPKTEYGQISTSSKTELKLHTETAFHPYKPDHIFLLCLRGDQNAPTTYATVSTIVDKLLYKFDAEDVVDELQLPNFETSLDDSFMVDGTPNSKFVMPILRLVGDPRRTDAPWHMTYDHHLMRGLTPGAERALQVLEEAISESIEEYALDAGQLLIINNNTVIHGRKPFQARYDGTDRWLLRAMTRRILPAKEHFDFVNNVITTTFGQSSHA